VLLLQTLGLGLGLALERPGLGLGLRYQGLGLDTNGLINITGYLFIKRLQNVFHMFFTFLIDVFRFYLT